eukprot:COSAG06_NODE_63456_length_262_cov_0.638037_1_plen_26_part_10
MPRLTSSTSSGDEADGSGDAALHEAG